MIDGWEAAWSGHVAGAFAEVCAPGIQYEDPLTDRPLSGLEDARGPRPCGCGRAFPTCGWSEPGRVCSDAHFVAAPAKLMGTHRGPLDSLPATSRFVVVHCVFYCELTNERLLRVRAFYDVYDAATQLGILPARGTLGEKALLMLRGFGLRSARGA